MKTQNENTPEVKQTIELGGIKFTEGRANVRSGGAAARFLGREKGPSEISLNADLLADFPDLVACERVRVYVAEGPKPIVLLLPAKAGEGVRLVDNGSKAQRPRKVIKGTVLRALSAYRAIQFRIERIKSPVAGWQLVPVTSEKKGGA